MTGRRKPHFPEAEFEQRRQRARRDMAGQGLDALLVSSPENIYYLSGLDHMGYFACQLLLLPLEGQPVLVTRAMEKATVRDQVPHLRHVGYIDGSVQPRRELALDISDPLEDAGLVGEIPWQGSVGSEDMPVRPAPSPAAPPAAAHAASAAIAEAGLDRGRIGIEKGSTFMPYGIAEHILDRLPLARFTDASGLVDRCRFVQSPRELACTRQAATVSDSMMLAAVAAAGQGVHVREVMAAAYDAMFRRGGTYPGFVPLVRTQRTLEHEHGTWQDLSMARNDILFIELAGCIRRYHAPTGRLAFIGKAPKSALRVNEVCQRALEKVVAEIGPGARAGEVYRAWQSVVDGAGLSHYRRHHCGYSVGIGFPPSWSGSGVPVGLRPDSDMELEPGMVFHLLSWMLRTGKGDAFLSDTAVVTEDGCQVLTHSNRGVTVRH